MIHFGVGGTFGGPRQETPPKPVWEPAMLTGRCANGYERGKGSVIHAVQSGDSSHKALCGRKHGARSAGWSVRFGAQLTCPRCQRAVLKLEASTTTHGSM